MNINASTIIWYAKHYAEKLGLWGLLGSTFLVLSYFYYQANVIQVREQTAVLHAEKIAAEAKQTQPVTEIEPEVTAPDESDITHFYQRFPQVEALPKVLGSINAIAKQHKITLNSGDYKLDKLKTKRNAIPKTLTKYQISFPVVGRYRNIRLFTQQVLQKLPGIALTDMQMKREQTTDAQLEATLVYVLFVKGEAW